MPDPTRTDVSICGEALTLIGQTPIQSFSESTVKAGVCVRTYKRLKRSVLGSHPWKFSFKKAQLSQLLAAPLTQWTYQYNLPGDRLHNFPYRLFEVADVGAEEFRKFEAFGDKIMTDATTLFIDYQYDAPESTWDEAFVEFFVTALASELAYPLTKDIRVSQSFRRDAYGTDPDRQEGGLYQKAKTQNMINHPVRTYGDSTLAAARFGSTSTVVGNERFIF